MAAKEEISADIHMVADDAVDGFPIISTRFVADQDHIVLKGVDNFDFAADELLEDVEIMGNIAQNGVFFVTDEQDFQADPLLFYCQMHYRTNPGSNARLILLNANPS